MATWQWWLLGGVGLSKEVKFELSPEEQTSFSRKRRWGELVQGEVTVHVNKGA